MPWRNVPAFMERLRERDSLSARALEFLILTASRTGEVIGMRWDEVDFEAKVWMVPAGRMKAKVEHRVPLSDRAVEILKGLATENNAAASLIFPLSNMALLQMLRGMDGNGFTTHGFRSAFRDWCGERTNFARDIIEFALAHKLPDKVEAAYRRETAVEKRRALMQAWAKYCESNPMQVGEVVALHA
jgi:integrase